MAMDEPRFYHGQSDKDGKWYFHLQGKNGEVMMPSEGYETEWGALHGIEAVKRAVLEIVAAEAADAVDEARRQAEAPLNAEVPEYEETGAEARPGESSNGDAHVEKEEEH